MQYRVGTYWRDSKMTNFIGQLFYKIDVYSDDGYIDPSRMFEVVEQGPFGVIFDDGSQARIKDGQVQYCEMI